jgi:hypothetical protein
MSGLQWDRGAADGGEGGRVDVAEPDSDRCEEVDLPELRLSKLELRADGKFLFAA